MTDKEYDILFKQMLEKRLEEEFSDIPPEDEIEYEFSEEFSRKMDRLLISLDSPHHKFFNTSAKRAAVIVVCFIIAFSSLMSVEAIRENALNLFYRIFDTHTSISPDDTQVREEIDTFYSIPFVPEGYISINESKNILGNDVVYENADGKTIMFYQHLANGDATLDSEDSFPKEVTVNDTTCLFINKNGKYRYYWDFDGYRFTLTYPSELGEEFAERVIGKLIKSE